MPSARDRILEAARALLREQRGVRLTVRAVAARAEVGIGTLRHHFPTQRHLYDAVLTDIYREAMPDDVMLDMSVAAPDRLVGSLQHLLAPIGVDDEARRFWSAFHEDFFAPLEARARETWPDLSAQTRQRIEGWLALLVGEGALAAGDNSARARVLFAVVNGLALERGLPGDVSALELETMVLRRVVDGLLDGTERQPSCSR
ncbi:TetR/AcrR family transcriptional regulator [Pseudokineococcus basanitobsidens]|uniref:TetR/AcrR family transcriptional regulator n=1 Tax=Pseudokineococcus basanitobsidens TaxID=1926649 RepID=A0ABU8RIA7_9ACTN